MKKYASNSRQRSGKESAAFCWIMRMNTGISQIHGTQEILTITYRRRSQRGCEGFLTYLEGKMGRLL